MVSANKAGFDLRETHPLPRNTLHSLGWEPGSTRQRTNPDVTTCLKGYREGIVQISLQRLHQVNLERGRKQPPTLVPFGIPRRAGLVGEITATYGISQRPTL
jgi:hypothetical protein